MQLDYQARPVQYGMEGEKCDSSFSNIMTFNPAAAMQMPTAESILRAQIPLLNSIVTHRLIRCFVIEALDILSGLQAGEDVKA